MSLRARFVAIFAIGLTATPLFFTSSAQAALSFDFENPPYTLGPLDADGAGVNVGQQGWNARQSDVYAGDGTLGPLAGAASIDQFSTGVRYAYQNLAGAGLEDGAVLSYLTARKGGSGSTFHEAILYGGAGTDKFVHVGMDSSNSGQVYAYDGAALVASPAGFAPALSVIEVESTMNFSAGTYTVEFTNVTANTVFNTGPLAMNNSVTAAQAEAGGRVDFTSAGREVYVDNVFIGVVPEPAGLAFLGLGLASALGRARTLAAAPIN
jgi:hypothetical protein